MEERILEVVIRILKNKGKLSFDSLWKEISKEFNLNNEEDKANFYLQLTLDGRFKNTDDLWEIK